MKTHFMLRSLILVGASTGLSTAATVTVSYGFDNTSDPAADRLAPTSVSLPNLTASSITKSGFSDPSSNSNPSVGSPGSFVLVTASGNPNGHLAAYFPNTTAANDSEAEVEGANHYFQLTLTPAAGYVLDLSTLTLDYTASNNSNGRTFFVRYDHSGMPNTFAGPNLSEATFTGMSGEWVSDFGNIGNLNSIPVVNGDADESVTLRFYGYRETASTISQNLRYDDITITAELSAIPEPSTSLITAGLLLAGLCRRSHR